MSSHNLPRVPEPELMDLPDEVAVYANADFSAVNQMFVTRLLELAGDLDTANAADLGCGPCDITIRAAKARPGWRFSAVDASAPMLATASIAIQNADLQAVIIPIQTDAKGSGLAGESFDIVFSNSLLHHVSSPLQFWSELKRILKPGGLLLVRDLFRPENQARANELVIRHAGNEPTLLQQEFHRSLLAAYTPQEIELQLVKAGMAHMSVVLVSDRHVDIFGWNR